MSNEAKPKPIIVGGGIKKVLYSLQTLQRIGLLSSGKALSSRNACKACGLGMGGQQGGMTNERGEFPSVCNKSIQAQSTDIQPPIPTELFQHELTDFQQLSAYELEHLGRLDSPLYKAAGASGYQPIDWSRALDLAVTALRQTEPQRSFFYSSGRSSNEAGFVLQLLARLYGSNHINNCSYYCHQASSVGMQQQLGTGTATLSLDSLTHADCILVIGANPASNHPRFIHQLKNCRERGGQVLVINPAKEPGLVRFAVPKSLSSMLAGGSDIASCYLQPHIGSDLWLLQGIAKAVIAERQQDQEFIDRYSQGFADWCNDLQALSWADISQHTGLSQTEIEAAARLYGQARRAVFAWGMGITHHHQGVANVQAIVNLALLRGMLGKEGAGLLPLRGHSNIQGIGTVGVKPELASPVLQALEQKLGLRLPEHPGLDTLGCLRAASAGEMDLAVLMGGNLLSASPDTAGTLAALNRIRFKLYLTTTLNQSHLYAQDQGEALILPVTARDEESQPTTQESMFNYVRLSDGGIRRLRNARPEVEILSQLGAALLPNSPIDFAQFGDHRQIQQWIAETIPGLSALGQIQHSRQEFHIEGRLFDAARLAARPLLFARLQPAPQRVNPAYPMRLASIRSEGQFNSIIYEQRDSYRGADSRHCLLMNAEDLADLALQPGQRVKVSSVTGELRGLQPVAFALPRGNLLAYYPEANVLIAADPAPGSQTPAFKSVAVRVEPDVCA